MADLIRLRGRHRAAAAIEVAVLIPLLGLALAVLVTGWRVGWARAQVADAVAAGARAASIPLSGEAAARQGASAVSEDLKSVGIYCAELHTAVDVSAYANPVGVPGQVSLTASCVLDLTDVTLPGVPGKVTIKASASEPLDTFRERKP